MKLMIRLLFLVVFFVYGVPKVMEYLQMHNTYTLQQRDAKNEQAGQYYAEGLSKKKSKTKRDLQDSMGSVGIFDSNLRKCILNNLDVYTLSPEPLGELGVRNITRLLCEQAGISSIEGLGQLRSLSSLSLRGNSIDDVYPLAGLKQLKNLDLSNNKNLRDVSALGRLSTLESLSLTGNNQIENIAALADIKTLRSISLPHMQETYCYEVARLVANMRENHESGGWRGVSENSGSVNCRGKHSHQITSILRKQERGESLSYDERKTLSDYEHDQSMSKYN